MVKEDDFYIRLGSLIKKRREALTLTQADVASSVGISRTSLTNIECGRQRLMVDQLQKICTTLNEPIGRLLNKVESESLSAPAPQANSPSVSRFLESVGVSQAS